MADYVDWMGSAPGGDSGRVLLGLAAASLLLRGLLDRVDVALVLAQRLDGTTWDEVGHLRSLTGPEARARFEADVALLQSHLGAQDRS